MGMNSRMRSRNCGEILSWERRPNADPRAPCRRGQIFAGHPARPERRVLYQEAIRFVPRDGNDMRETQLRQIDGYQRGEFVRSRRPDLTAPVSLHFVTATRRRKRKRPDRRAQKRCPTLERH